MEDLLSEVPLKKEGIKVIAIKLPFDMQERFHTFPFLHAIRAFYPKADLHLITPKKNIEMLNLLPFSAYYHEFDEHEIKNVFDVHRFCAFSKIHNLDLFISLTNSFADACLGLGLRAKHRLGFADGWKGVVLTEKTMRPKGQHVSEDFFALYKLHTGDDYDSKQKVLSRDLPYVIEDYDTNPYVAVNLSPLRHAGIEQEWIDLVSKFERTRFVFFASEDQEKIPLLWDNFMALCPPNNQYMFFKAPTWIELGKMLAYARGVITYNGAGASVSAYVGSKTLILYDSEDPQTQGPFYFQADINLMAGNDATITNKEVKTVLRARTTFNMDEVAKRAREMFVF